MDHSDPTRRELLGVSLLTASASRRSRVHEQRRLSPGKETAEMESLRRLFRGLQLQRGLPLSVFAGAAPDLAADGRRLSCRAALPHQPGRLWRRKA